MDHDDNSTENDSIIMVDDSGMENGDSGVIAFKDNVVLRSFRLKNRSFINMEDYDTAENRAAVEELIRNTDYVDIHEDGTTIWKGRTDKKGYALISSKKLPNRPEGDNGKTIRLHRLLQQMFNNGAPVNAYVCHRDDNPANITPSNLFQGTPGNNSLCIILHNRRIYPSGQDHWNCKIRDAQIVEMIHLHYANAMSITDLADKYNIHPNHAGKLINGHLRKYITQKAIRAAIAARR